MRPQVAAGAALEKAPAPRDLARVGAARPGSGVRARGAGRVGERGSARPGLVPRGLSGEPGGTTFAGGRTKARGENVATKVCLSFSLFSCRR